LPEKPVEPGKPIFMCGIAGFVNTDREGGAPGLIERMTNVIRHRGPDDSGFYPTGRGWLGHRRLSIVDLALGHQPISNETGDVWIVYNGEIFNHADLRPDLERAGHHYASRSDTETIIHAYEEYGPDCVNRFRGMFSFAIWDEKKQTLFCARDRLGKKPFYYYWDGRLFAFASEIKALFEHPSISPAFDESLLPEYLAFGYTSGVNTLFSGILKLMPGQHLTLKLDVPRPEPQIERYWDIPAPGPIEQRDDRAWIKECRERLEETVRMRLMSDVPLGMFLSGGLDSSTIAALMKRMVSGPVKTFAVGYQEAAYSELEYARHVAKSVGTEHHEVVVGMEDFFGALPRLIWHEDEPVTWPSSVSLHAVSKLAAEQVKVVLTGEGSDELFGGYSRYHFYLWNQQWLRWYGWLPAPLRRAVQRGIADSPLLSGELRRKLGHTFLGRGADVESLYLDNFYSAFTGQEQAALVSRKGGRSPYREFLRRWEERSAAPPLQRMLYADQKTYLVELLMKQDQMSMAASIESRVPFLDHELVEFAVRTPESLKIRNGEGKYIVKKAVEDLLPREIIYRKKMGFPTPIRQWLRDGRAKEMLAGLTDRNGFVGAYLNTARIQDLLDRNQSGSIDATDRIWRLLNLQLWGDLFFTGKRESVLEGQATRC
jgi:asparagine synthase (glutamine-hydrolysing)